MVVLFCVCLWGGRVGVCFCLLLVLGVFFVELGGGRMYGEFVGLCFGVVCVWFICGFGGVWVGVVGVWGFLVFIDVGFCGLEFWFWCSWGWREEIFGGWVLKLSVIVVLSVLWGFRSWMF